MYANKFMVCSVAFQIATGPSILEKVVYLLHSAFEVA